MTRDRDTAAAIVREAKALAFLLEVIPLGTSLATVYGDQLPGRESWEALLTRVVTALMPPS